MIFALIYIKILYSSNLLENGELTEKDIMIVCDMLDLTVSLETFDYNINTIGSLDTKLNFEILNNFSLWGPRSALNKVLCTKGYVGSAADKLNTNVLNVIILLASSTKIQLEVVSKILQLQREGTDPSKNTALKSKYLKELLSYTRRETSIDFQYSSLLLLYTQDPARKVRLLFDIYNKNDDGFLSRSEIVEVLESSLSKSGLSVDDTLIEDLCQTLGRIILKGLSLFCFIVNFTLLYQYISSLIFKSRL